MMDMWLLKRLDGWKRTSGVTGIASSAGPEHRMGAAVSRSARADGVYGSEKV